MRIPVAIARKTGTHVGRYKDYIEFREMLAKTLRSDDSINQKEYWRGRIEK